jgi:hypothetical protein
MAFLKYGSAVVTKPSTDHNEWTNVKEASGHTNSFQKTASILSNYPPEKYLLTHATIVASVDTEEAPNVKAGKVVENGREIDRITTKYYITPETSKYINQNNDAFEKQLLLNTFRTFIGASNFLEHIQVVDLEKGKVLDAVARDLEDTVYVDILVATDRKHEQLIKDIEAGKLNALSMGCKIAYSICSHCGNKAVDMAELCEHIKYRKGESFVDVNGKERKIAELCGHSDDLESVTFIEASWVANPAFKGAVVRNLLNPKEELSESAKKAMTSFREAVSSSPLLAEFLAADNIDRFIHTAGVTMEEMDSLRLLKEGLRQVEASLSKEAFGGFGDDDDEEEEDTPPIEEIKTEVKDHLRKQIKKDLIKEMEDELELDDKVPMFKGPSDIENVNNNIITAFQTFSNKYSREIRDPSLLKNVFSVLHTAKTFGWESCKELQNVSNRDILTAMYLRDRDFERKPLGTEVYACLLKVGGSQNYTNLDAFLNACGLALGVDSKTASLGNELAKTLIELSHLLK